VNQILVYMHAFLDDGTRHCRIYKSVPRPSCHIRSLLASCEVYPEAKTERGHKKRVQAFDVGKLKQPKGKAAFDTEISNRFVALKSVGLNSVEPTWSNF